MSLIEDPVKDVNVHIVTAMQASGLSGMHKPYRCAAVHHRRDDAPASGGHRRPAAAAARRLRRHRLRDVLISAQRWPPECC